MRSKVSCAAMVAVVVMAVLLVFATPESFAGVAAPPKDLNTVINARPSAGRITCSPWPTTAARSWSTAVAGRPIRGRNCPVSRSAPAPTADWR